MNATNSEMVANVAIFVRHLCRMSLGVLKNILGNGVNGIASRGRYPLSSSINTLRVFRRGAKCHTTGKDGAVSGDGG